MTWALVGLGILFTLPIVVLGAGFLVMMIARPGLPGRRGGAEDPGLLGAHRLGDHPDQQPPGTGD